LKTNKNSRIIIAVAAHGGENFIKFQGKVVILSDELNRALWEMYYKNRYREILFILDTCEGFSLFEYVDVPNVYFITSSVKDQKASSHNYNYKLMTPTSDRMHFKLYEYLERAYREKSFNVPIHDFFTNLKEREKDFIKSTVSIDNRFTRNAFFYEFFGNYLTPNHPVEKYNFTPLPYENGEKEVKEVFNYNNQLSSLRIKADEEVSNLTKVSISKFSMASAETTEFKFEYMKFIAIGLILVYILILNFKY
jgi:glycosylphosphatidylinositol transamidase (GPIT) subunit GPI8